MKKILFLGVFLILGLTSKGQVVNPKIGDIVYIVITASDSIYYGSNIIPAIILQRRIDQKITALMFPITQGPVFMVDLPHCNDVDAMLVDLSSSYGWLSRKEAIQLGVFSNITSRYLPTSNSPDNTPYEDYHLDGFSDVEQSIDTVGVLGGKLITWYANNILLSGKSNNGHTHGYSSLTGLPTLNLSDWNTAFGWGNHASAGYLTSFSETDPNVPAYSKTLSAFSVIKTSTDALYSALAHTHTFASLTSKPTTLLGYGITDAYPLSGNPSGFLTSEVDGSTTNEIELPSQTGNAGRTLRTNGTAVSWGKRQETYSGTTDGSGLYTVTFGTAYSAAPNIQANVIGGSTEQMSRIVSVSTTGFQIHVFQRATVLGLALSTATTNVSGANVDVLVTEK